MDNVYDNQFKDKIQTGIKSKQGEKNEEKMEEFTWKNLRRCQFDLPGTCEIMFKFLETNTFIFGFLF